MRMRPWPLVDELMFLVGYQLTAVRVASWPVDLYFSKPPEVVIGLRSRVRIEFADGRIVEPVHLPDTGIVLIGLIGITITAVELNNPYSLNLMFEGGTITMECADDQYESFSIVGDGHEIYV